jgi:hypothetical protein
MARKLPMANQAMGMNPMMNGGQNQFPMVGPQRYDIQQPKKGFGQGIKEFFAGAPAQAQLLPTQSGPQQQVQGQALQNVLQMLQGGQNAPSQFDFNKIKQGVQNRFQTETLPSIAERFTGLGDAQGSSGYLSTLGRAGADLDIGLGSLEAQFGQQQQQQDRDYLLQLLRFALMPQFENQYIPATGGLFGNASQGVGQGLGQLGGLGALKYLGFL